MSMHMELIMSISEYTATPKVAANSPIPLTIIDGIEEARAFVTETQRSAPAVRSALYLVVIRIA